VKQVEALLTAPGAKFEMETVTIHGVPTRTWKNAPPHMAALVALSHTHGERLATIYEDERVSYDAQFRAIAALAADLAAGGVGKGDRVVIAMRNLPEWVVAFFAVTTLGAIAVPLNAWWTGEELAYGLADSGAKVLIADDERWQRISPLRHDLPHVARVLVSRATQPLDGAERLEEVIGTPHDWPLLPVGDLPAVALLPEDEATILYTSGTTGKPKGALGTHRNFMTNILSTGYAMARTILRRGDALPEPSQKVALTVIPLFHATALSSGLMGAMAAGHTIIYMRKFEPIRAMEIIEREKVNSTGGVPTIAWQLIEHPDRHRYDLSSLETIGYGGAPSAPELVRKIAGDLKVAPGNGWGMTETTATVTTHSGEDYVNRPESCGPAVAVADLRITDAHGRDVPAGEVGELWARGPMIVKGYWNRPEATAATFVDGWVRTGDLARLDDEGFCYIVDRAKDMVIRGGENIYSSEVENVLYDHPAVTDCALIGVPHRTLGEEPGAVVHLAPGATATEDELQAWVRERLAAFKVPVAIRFSDTLLPRNANGKILKRDLKTYFEDRTGA
jgi:acyl-CoA synthetase (AMP-forming)/AMP-acid ligase II